MNLTRLTSEFNKLSEESNGKTIVFPLSDNSKPIGFMLVNKKQIGYYVVKTNGLARELMTRASHICSLPGGDKYVIYDYLESDIIKKIEKQWI